MDIIHVDGEDGRRDGFSTKFYYLVDDDMDRESAETKLKVYQTKYDDRITEIEEDDTLWDSFPFKENVIVYSK